MSAKVKSNIFEIAAHKYNKYMQIMALCDVVSNI